MSKTDTKKDNISFIAAVTDMCLESTFGVYCIIVQFIFFLKKATKALGSRKYISMEINASTNSINDMDIWIWKLYQHILLTPISSPHFFCNSSCKISLFLSLTLKVNLLLFLLRKSNDINQQPRGRHGKETLKTDQRKGTHCHKCSWSHMGLCENKQTRSKKRLAVYISRGHVGNKCCLHFEVFSSFLTVTWTKCSS